MNKKEIGPRSCTCFEGFCFGGKNIRPWCTATSPLSSRADRSWRSSGPGTVSGSSASSTFQIGTPRNRFRMRGIRSTVTALMQDSNGRTSCCPPLVPGSEQSKRRLQPSLGRKSKRRGRVRGRLRLELPKSSSSSSSFSTSLHRRGQKRLGSGKPQISQFHR